jgi:hypothetical protein
VRATSRTQSHWPSGVASSNDGRNSLRTACVDYESSRDNRSAVPDPRGGFEYRTHRPAITARLQTETATPINPRARKREPRLDCFRPEDLAPLARKLEEVGACPWGGRPCECLRATGTWGLVHAIGAPADAADCAGALVSTRSRPLAARPSRGVVSPARRTHRSNGSGRREQRCGCGSRLLGARVEAARRDEHAGGSDSEQRERGGHPATSPRRRLLRSGCVAPRLKPCLPSRFGLVRHTIVLPLRGGVRV